MINPNFSMPIPSSAEKMLQNTIFPELENGRPDYDKPHTIGVVSKVRDLIKHNPELELDEAVLIIVAYAHDWGYADLFHNGIADFETVKNAKHEHMRLSAQKIDALLNDSVFSFLTHDQKARIVEIVSKHDELKSLHDADELVFMEADTLGALDTDFVTPTFDYASNEKYMKGPLQHRLSLFITQYGKEDAKRCVKQRMDYYFNMK